jgi:hypothetical protein
MGFMRNGISMGLVVAVLGAAILAVAPRADAGVRIIRRSTCAVPGYYLPPSPHVHSYVYQEQRIFIGYDPCGFPVYEIRYVRVPTCGCR